MAAPPSGASLALLDKLIAAYNPVEGRAICVPTFKAKRGNPVLWSKRFLPAIAAIAGGESIAGCWATAGFSIAAAGGGALSGVSAVLTAAMATGTTGMPA